MERKIPFLVGETYHVYTRGVDKRIVCETNYEYEHLQLLLYLCNDAKAIHMRRLRTRYRGFPSAEIFKQEESTGALVDILAYALMPNHFHLLLREKIPGGISRFMLKLMTAYSMYFNTKHERSGPLFTRPFRSKHVDDDSYLLWLYAYILLNPLSLLQSDWKSGIRNVQAARQSLQSYQYSSFIDRMDARPASKILTIDERLPKNHSFDTLLGLFETRRGEPFA